MSGNRDYFRGYESPGASNVLPVNRESPLGEQSGEPFLDCEFDEVGVVRSLELHHGRANGWDIGGVQQNGLQCLPCDWTTR